VWALPTRVSASARQVRVVSSAHHPAVIASDRPRAQLAAVLPFWDVNVLDRTACSDEHLADMMLALLLAHYANHLGLELHQITEEQLTSWTRRIALAESADPLLAGWEKACRLSAMGQRKQAGHSFRILIADMMRRRLETALVDLTTQQHDQLARNARRGAAASRRYSNEGREQWREIAARPQYARLSKRRRAELVARELNLPPAAVETIRKVI
jgi:hypothetical protein